MQGAENIGGPWGMFARFCEQMESLGFTPESLQEAIDRYWKDRGSTVKCELLADNKGVRIVLRDARAPSYRRHLLALDNSDSCPLWT